jgi:uncharacterized YigZ family protein
MTDYKTILAPGEASFTIQRSRFITHTAPSAGEAEAQAFLLQIKKRYYDARHHCSAWVLGSDGSRQKSNDDGEPGGTAGAPILEAIRQNGLTNLIVVVTRYFGGIKLGAGGLIRAYSHAAALGLNASPQAQMTAFRRAAVTIAYPLLGTLENWLRQKNIRVENNFYAEDVTLILLLEPENLPAITAGLTDLTAARCVIQLQDEIYLPVPLPAPETQA